LEAKIFLAVRRALSPASGTRNKTSPTADAFFDRTASLNDLSSRRKFFSGFIFIRRSGALISLLIVNHLISPNTFRISEAKWTLRESGKAEI
jgi:hypothetical protein